MIAVQPRQVVLVLCATCLIGGANAHAQQVGTAAANARSLDAHADRVLLVPTAETQPEGTFFVTAYELILPSLGYAITDDVQISAFGATDLEGGLLELRVKANVLRSRALRVALGTSLDYVAADPDDQDDPDAENNFLLGRADAALQLCFDEPCRSSLSGALTAAAPAQSELIFPIAFGAGLVVQGSSIMSVLLEYSALVNAADDLDLLPLPLHLVSYGVRFAWSPRWALDVGLLRSLNPERSIRTTPPEAFDLLGLPLFALSYRTGPSARSSSTYP